METTGVALSTGQIVALLAGAVGTIGTLLGIIRHQYETAYAKMEARYEQGIKELREAHAAHLAQQDRDYQQRLADILAAHERTTGRLDARIRWYEERDAKWSASQENYIASLEKVVEVQQRQTDAITALAERTPARPPRARPGD